MSGTAHILDAYCPHQGANLGVGGSVVDDNIRCPFHNWQFNGDGVCTVVPGLQDSKLPKATIKKWQTFEINNWVYIWYDKDDNDPTWTPPKLPGIDSVKFERQIEIDVNCHIMDLYGNSFDVDHLDGLHSMSGFVSDHQVLTRGNIYHFVKKILRLKVYNKFIYEESENKRWVEIDNRSIPVLFGIPLDWMAITGTLIFCPNVIYARWNFTNLNIKFNTLLSNIPISALKWHILNTSYHDNSGFLSKLMARFAIAYFKGQVMPEYIILNNKRFLKSPHMTVLDKPQAKFFRWMSDNYYNSKSQ